MYRKLLCVVASFSLFYSNLLATPLPDLYSDGAILIEPITNTILFAKNDTETFYPASTTKILTSLILTEESDMQSLVTKTQDAVNNVPSDSSQIGLNVNDTYTSFDGLHAIMMASDNFVCYDMAVLNAGSISAFAKKMNEKAISLGATSSNFVNPHGYHDENHYTTPYDLSQIARVAFANETLSSIGGTVNYDFTVQSSGKIIPLTHTSSLFDKTSPHYNPHVVSCKTGYHTPAKRTLVTKAVYDDIELVAVVMRADAPNQYVDMNNLLEYGAENFKLVTDENGMIHVENMTYSPWASTYIQSALDNGWIVSSTRNYLEPVTKRELLTLFSTAVPFEYQAFFSRQILCSKPSIYKENLNITRKDAALVCYNLLKELGFDKTYYPLPLNIADLSETSAIYDQGIELVVRAGIMPLDENGAFSPEQPVSFQEAIYMAHKLIDFLNRYDNYTYTK